MIAGLWCFNLWGQPVFFNHIGQEDGLRNGNVRTLVKDHQGFIWIGTEDGLHRYDGYSMKIYRNRESDSTSISSNFIICLFEDSKKNLWIGTLDGGLCVYDRRRDTFRKFPSQASTSNARINDAIRVITEGRDHYLYVGSNGLTKAKVSADIDSIHFEQVALPAGLAEKEATKVLSIAEGPDGDLLIAINANGLFNYDCSAGEFSPHAISQLEKTIFSIYVDTRRNLIWIGSWKNGVVIYDPHTGKHARITAGNNTESLRSNQVSAITADTGGNVWVATENGLSVIPHDSNPFVKKIVNTYLPDRLNQTSIHGSIIKAVYVDNHDKLWVGAYYEGLNVYDKHAMNFGTLSIPKEILNGPLYTNISAIAEDTLHRFWVGLDGGGLFLFQGKLDKPLDLKIEPITVCSNTDKVKALTMDRDHNLWIGTWGNGLFMLNTTTRQCRNLEEFCAELDIGKEIMSLDADAAGNLWIGTFDHGLFRYTMASNQLVKIRNIGAPSNFVDRINALFVDAEDNVWVGKIAGGLRYIHRGASDYTDIITDHLGATTTVSALYRDQQGTLWIGAPNDGLIEYDPQTQRSRLFGEEQGLANSMIYSIAEDSLGRLWLSSNMGISLFEKRSGKFTNFSKANGLSTNQFNRGSVAGHLGSYLAFGSIRGLNFFQPNVFEKKNEDISVVFTRLLLNNHEQPVGGAHTVLPENITTIRALELQHHQNSFSIEFAGLNFNFTNQTVYAYRLEGFDKDWQYAGNRRLASYTNLAPGTYRLQVRASDSKDHWPSSYHELQLRIVPAWWQTIWFKAGLVLVFVLFVIGVHKIRIRYLLVQKEKLEELVKTRTQKLNAANTLLNTRIEEINSINALLSRQQNQIIEKNNEIQAQNEELLSQNEQIAAQHERLVLVEKKLREVNASLERTVDERTEKLQHTIDNLNKTVFELDRFVYSASHDLSAPLKSILGLVGIIRIEKDPVQVHAYIEYIKDAVVKLEAVITSMVDYARNAHTVIQSEHFNLLALVNEVIGEFAFLPEVSTIVYSNRIDPGLQIQSDRTRIKVVLHNLIGNSTKYIDKYKEERWIRIECEQAGKYWRLRIMDNGIGIKKEYLDKVFNMYFRATEKSKGSGLGLFIVKETLTKLGGTITVQSEFGAYTTFELLIPRGAA